MTSPTEALLPSQLREIEERDYLDYPEEASMDRRALLQHIRSMEAELREARRDAERYRWLRRNDITSQAGVYSDDDCNHWLTEKLLDDVVDAEMAAHNAGKSIVGVAWPLIDAAMEKQP